MLIIRNKMNTLAVMSYFLVITNTLSIHRLIFKVYITSNFDNVMIKQQLVYVE